MEYIVTSTEKTRKTASEQETKALLYLMNFRADSGKIHYFVIDFFNDVTGVDSMASEAWDVQSKASQNLSGKMIGRDLVTLYKNFLSEFNFSHYIMFIGGVAEKTRVDQNLNEFYFSNFKPKTQQSIIVGLTEEAKEKTYIKNKAQITEESINNFLEKVLFVIDDKSTFEYVKKVIMLSPSVIVEDSYLNKIFIQIRDSHSIKKNIYTENVIINELSKFEIYNKYLTADEIKLMVLSRLLHRNGIREGVPIPFTILLDGRDSDERKVFIEKCQNDIFRMLYDKNNVAAYWELFEEVYKTVSNNKDLDVNELFKIVNLDKLKKVSFLDFNSSKYFIALVKEGLEL